MSWSLIKLSEICDLFNGYAFKSADYVDESNTLSCRMSNIRPGGKFDIQYNARYLPDDFAKKYEQFLLKDDDVVIAMTDLADSPKILGVPTVIKTNGKQILLNQRVGKLVIKDLKKVHFPYLQLALNSSKVRSIYKRFAGGGLQINLGKKDLLSVEIPLPPLPEQQKIAAILDAADQLRQKDQQLIEKYNTLSQSLFLDMFGDPTVNPYQWEIKNLSDVCFKITDGTHQSPTFLTNGIPFLLVSNIVDNEITYQTNKFISEEEYETLTKNTPIEVGDILYTSVGSYGNPAIVKSKERFCFQRHIAQIKLNHQLVNSKFLNGLLQTSSIKVQADKLARGVAQKTLNLAAIKSFRVIHPPITLQNQFSERIQAIEAQKQQAQASLQKSEDLFNSLLQRAFKGELTA